MATAPVPKSIRMEGYKMRAEKGGLRCFVFGVLFFTCMAWALVNCSVSQAGLYTLYSFEGVAGNGAYPYGSITLFGSTFYGMTERGGDYGNGAIFRINTDGSGYRLLHSFAGPPTDGANPYGPLTLSGSTLYGMSAGGGLHGDGAIFRINTDGSGYQVLHSFAGAPTDGANPYGALVRSGSTLYGMTEQGGSTVLWGGGYADFGTIFRINTDGSGYEVLHHFGINEDDGANPYGSLALAGSTLYGMTSGGGNFSRGTIFRINKDGSGYEPLYSFSNVGNDGAHPYGSLTLAGSALYGMTHGGGVDGLGAIFKINPDGSGYRVLHSFGSVANDGANPLGPLTISGSTLYGMTPNGGGNQFGTIFQIKTDGSGYQVLYSFISFTDLNVLYPLGPLTISNAVLYGTTVVGGENDAGAVFVLDTSATGSLWQNAVDLGKGWKWFDWFGYFNINSSPWIYHSTLGWLYAYGTSTDSIWFWDAQMNAFWWTSRTTYPYLYRASDGSWLYYQEGSSNPCWFYNFNTGRWESD